MINRVSVGIIGYGRFGQLLADLLANDFKIQVHDIYIQSTDTVIAVDLKKIALCSTLFIATPIREMQAVLQSLSPYLTGQHTLIDTCSVKCYPVDMMQKYLPKKTGIIASHPMFGPDSIQKQKRPKWVLHPIRDLYNVYPFWKQYLNKKFDVINLTPEQHDQYAAKSQGITHLIGRILESMEISTTPIDTFGFEQLLKLMQQTCYDNQTLFVDLQRYNPFSQAMFLKFEKAFLKMKTLINAKE